MRTYLLIFTLHSSFIQEFVSSLALVNAQIQRQLLPLFTLLAIFASQKRTASFSLIPLDTSSVPLFLSEMGYCCQCLFCQCCPLQKYWKHSNRSPLRHPSVHFFFS